MNRRLPLLVATLTATLLVGTSCASQPDAPTPTATSGDGHGDVAGAQELGEPALALAYVDGAGLVHQLDLVDESISEIAELPASPSTLSTDGRYLLAQSSDGVTFVDSGRWTWDHVDHFHYYLAEPRSVGTVPGDGVAAVASTNSSTTGGMGLHFPASGDAVLLDVEALARGELVELFRIPGDPHPGLVVPVGSFALVTVPEAGVAASVVAYTADGERLADIGEECPDARGTITTRVGAVIGCADGALLAHVEGGELHLERIALPEGSSAAAPRSFANREGRPTVAGLADESRIWMLDTRDREWTLLESPVPLLQVTAVDDEAEHVLGLTVEGGVVVLYAATGALLATTEPLVAESIAAGAGGIALIADQQRAYLNGPAENRLFEIDFADGARTARTFDTPTEPAFLAETGR